MMNLYKVTICRPVLNEHYYIVAEGFDAAATAALEIDHSTEGQSGGVSNIVLLCEAGGSDAAFAMTAFAAHSLGFN